MSTFLLIGGVGLVMWLLWFFTQLGGKSGKPDVPWSQPQHRRQSGAAELAIPARKPAAAWPPVPASATLQEHRRLVEKLTQDQPTKTGNVSPAPSVTVNAKEGPTISVMLRTPDMQRHPEPLVSDKDAWEGQYMEDYAQGMVERTLDGVSLNIKFVDREGKATQRDITVKRYAHNPATHGGVIYAYCHLRQGNRPFALGRIRSATDLSTGEVIQDVGAFLDAAYQETPRYAIEKFLEEHDAAMFVLFSFAKADGAMRVKERAIIKPWAVRYGLTQEQDVLALESQFKGWNFTKHSFYDAVKTVKKTKSPRELYADAMGGIPGHRCQRQDTAPGRIATAELCGTAMGFETSKRRV